MLEDEGEDEHEEHKREDEDEENIDTIIPDMIDKACHSMAPGVMTPADLQSVPRTNPTELHQRKKSMRKSIM